MHIFKFFTYTMPTTEIGSSTSRNHEMGCADVFCAKTCWGWVYWKKRRLDLHWENSKKLVFWERLKEERSIAKCNNYKFLERLLLLFRNLLGTRWHRYLFTWMLHIWVTRLFLKNCVTWSFQRIASFLNSFCSLFLSSVGDSSEPFLVSRTRSLEIWISITSLAYGFKRIVVSSTCSR